MALLCAWWISLSIRRPVNRLREAVDALAAGQLDSVIPHTDYQNETATWRAPLPSWESNRASWTVQRWIKLR